MNQRFSVASGLVLALSLAAPVLAHQAAGPDKMPGIDKKPDPGKMSSTSTMDKMTAGMSAADKSEMKKMMDKMAAMPPAKRKKAMQKMTGMDKKPETGKMSGMGDKMGGMGKMGDKMMSGMGMMDKSEMKKMMDKMAAMPPAKRKKAMEKMTGMGKKSDPAKMSGMDDDMPGDM